MQKTCIICSSEFEAKRKDVLYCCNKCKRSSEYLNKPNIIKTCLHCSAQFETKRKDTQYLRLAILWIHNIIKRYLSILSY
jgi:hypothetical protein